MDEEDPLAPAPKYGEDDDLNIVVSRSFWYENVSLNLKSDEYLNTLYCDSSWRVVSYVLVTN